MTVYEQIARRMLDTDATTQAGVEATRQYAALPLEEKFKVLPILDHLRKEREKAADEQRERDLNALKDQ